MSEHMKSMMNTLTSLLAEEDNNLVEDAWHAVKGLTSRIPKEQLPQYVSSAREAIGTAKASSMEPFKPFLCLSVEVSCHDLSENVGFTFRRRSRGADSVFLHCILTGFWSQAFVSKKGLLLLSIFSYRYGSMKEFSPSDVRSTRPLTFYSTPQGMLSSSHPEERQNAADGLKELLLTATPEAVKAHVTSITGKKNEWPTSPLKESTSA